MQEIANLMQSKEFLLVIFSINILLIIGFIINTVNFIKIKKENKGLVEKLGRGTDIKEDLKSFIKRIEKLEEKNEIIINYCRDLEDNMAFCIQKIGMVRYSAFRDTGSDLSFALALLDRENNGVILNGIYSREMSNIYAKPVKKGETTYTLIDEEKQALKKAMNYKGERKNEN
ncbi:MAG: DUF4446 family protein [Clostridia bacterium]|nr:DUF4446 family protein [Clostridia bacterium]